MIRPTVSEFNFETKEEVVREMTDEEYQFFLQAQQDQAESELKEQERLAAEAATKAAVEAKLAALGLDLETVKLLAKLG